MATEQFANSAQTTLLSPITATPGSQTINVVNATAFPDVPQFRVRIGDELMLVTAVAGTAWTVDRPIESTSVAAHSAGATVTQVLTAAGVESNLLPVAEPGGKLTLASNTPWTTADVTGATTVYYTPLGSDRLSLYDPAAAGWDQYVFTQRSLTLSGLTSGKNYDVFAYNSSGTVTLELSTAWTNDTTRADALAAQDGVPVKSADPTRRYLGTVRTTSTTTTEDSVANRCLFDYYHPDLWKTTSAYNRLYYAGWSVAMGPQSWSNRLADTAGFGVTGAGAFVDVTTLSLTLPGAGRYLVIVNAGGQVIGSGTNPRIDSRITLNGVLVTDTTFRVVTAIGEINRHQSASMTVIVDATGAHALTVQAARAMGGGAWTASVISGVLMVERVG